MIRKSLWIRAWGGIMAAAVAVSTPVSVLATGVDSAQVLAVQDESPKDSQLDNAHVEENKAPDTEEGDLVGTGEAQPDTQETETPAQEDTTAEPAEEGGIVPGTAAEEPANGEEVEPPAETDGQSPVPVEEKDEAESTASPEAEPETQAEKAETVPEIKESVPEIKENVPEKTAVVPEKPAVVPKQETKPAETAAGNAAERETQAATNNTETKPAEDRKEPVSVYVAPSFKRTREVHATVLKDAPVYDGMDEEKEEAGRLLAGVDVRFIKEAGKEWAFIETADEEGTILRGFIDASLLNKEEKPGEEGKTVENSGRASSFAEEKTDIEEKHADTDKQEEDPENQDASGRETSAGAPDEESGNESGDIPPVTVLKKRGTNRAFTYTYTTTFNDLIQVKRIVSDGDEVAEYAKTFIGNPYKWGGESLTEGCDSSSFTRLIMRHFGITLPKGTYEQAWEGRMLPVEEARPGDLICYGNDNGVYHVLLCTSNDENGFMAVSAASARLGIAETKVDTEKACWACRLFNDDNGSTQASDIRELGRRAYNGDEEAREALIRILLKASEAEWNQYGLYRPVVVTQAILESGWCSFVQADIGGIQPEDNNILGMNADLNNSTWESPWTGGKASRYVPQVHNGTTTYNFEDMRTYEDIEACLSDYAAFKIGIHPELAGCTDINKVVDEGLRGYATSPTYNSRIKDMVVRYRVEEIAAEMEAEERAEALKAAEKENGEDPADEPQAIGPMAVPEEK